jgi:sugar/nucleoside kinase (ribokinase family)
MGGRRQQLVVIGDVGVDFVMGPIAEWPQVGTEILMDKSEVRPGGSAGNAVLAARYLGERAELVSAVGSDELGSWLRDQLDGEGAALAVCDGPTTLTVGVIHASGERTFFTTRGHLEHLTYELLRPHIPLGGPGSIALLSGAFLTPALRASYPHLIDELITLGYRVALDTNWPPPGWSAALRAEVTGWIDRCDHLLLNDLEVMSLADATDLDTALARLAPRLKPGATLVAKSGERGAVAVADGQRFECAAARATIFDTIGAGDSFNAGYLLARLHGAKLDEALAAGCKAAAAILSSFPRRTLRETRAPALERA